MGVGFYVDDPHMDLGPRSKEVMMISKMGFVMQMLKKVFSHENWVLHGSHPKRFGGWLKIGFAL